MPGLIGKENRITTKCIAIRFVFLDSILRTPAPAEDPAEEMFELVLGLVVEVDLPAEGLEQLADEPMGGLEVVRE
jgi:hypothetical protein